MYSVDEQDRVRSDVEAFRRYALEPAYIAPPAIEQREARVKSGAMEVTARLVRAESTTWNAWPDGTARLFNNRVAHLFDIEIVGDGPVGWMPSHTTLELNEPGAALPAAPGPETLLSDLLGLALKAERHLLDSELTERTRSAGAFRAAYLPPAGADRIAGVIAFPLWATDPSMQGPLAEKHVVAMRLTLTLMDSEGPRSVELVFE